jgi:hypothetical protein
MNKTSKQTTVFNLNPAEQVLIDKLIDVYALNSMDNIRTKYAEAWLALLKRAYPALDYPIVRSNDNQGSVGCGRQTWPSAYPPWPSGFFIESISLKSLSAADDARPNASIWIAPPNKFHIDLESHKKGIRQRAEDCFAQPLEEGKSESRISLWYYLPETKQELISALARNGGRDFFAMMQKHLERFRPLIPLIDLLFAKARRRSTTG